ncbi:RDD family protein [Nocardia sp. GP40]
MKGFELARFLGSTPPQPSENAVQSRGENQKPKRHGALDDPDYPSPRKLRRILAFALDVMIHVAAGAAVSVASAPETARYALLHREWNNLDTIPVLTVLYFLAASFINRVIIQAIFHTTVGKAVFGLVVLCPDNGRYPSFGRLVAIWLFDVSLPFAFFGDGIGPDRPEDWVPTAVRWRDVRATGRALRARG